MPKEDADKGVEPCLLNYLEIMLMLLKASEEVNSFLFIMYSQILEANLNVAIKIVQSLSICLVAEVKLFD